MSSRFGNPHTTEQRTALTKIKASVRFGLSADACPKEWSTATISNVLDATEPPIPEQSPRQLKHTKKVDTNQRRLALAVVPDASAEMLTVNMDMATKATEQGEYFVAAVCLHAHLEKKVALLLPKSRRYDIERMVRAFEHTTGMPTMFERRTSIRHIVVLSTSVFGVAGAVYIFGTAETLRAYQLALYCKYASSTMCAAPLKQPKDGVLMETRRPLDVLSAMINKEALSATQMQIIAETILRLMTMQLQDKRCDKKLVPDAEWPHSLAALNEIHGDGLVAKLQSELVGARNDQTLRIGSVMHWICFGALTKGEFVAVHKNTFVDQRWDYMLCTLLSTNRDNDTSALYQLLSHVQCNSDFRHGNCNVLHFARHFQFKQVVRMIMSCYISDVLPATYWQWLLSVMYVGPNLRCFELSVGNNGDMIMLNVFRKNTKFRCTYTGKRQRKGIVLKKKCKNKVLMMLWKRYPQEMIRFVNEKKLIVSPQVLPQNRLVCDIMNVVQNAICGSQKACFGTSQAITKTDTQTKETSHISIEQAVFKIA